MGHIAEGGAGVGAAQLRKLLFADFLVPGAEPRQYMEVPSFERLTAVVGEYLADLNAGALVADATPRQAILPAQPDECPAMLCYRR